jgi:hypothetical protein
LPIMGNISMHVADCRRGVRRACSRAWHAQAVVSEATVLHTLEDASDHRTDTRRAEPGILMGRYGLAPASRSRRCALLGSANHPPVHVNIPTQR